MVILNSTERLYLIIAFYVYDSKIHFIYTIPFIFRFLVLIVTSSNPVTVSLFLSQYNGVVSPSMLLIVVFGDFGGFPHCPQVWPLIWIAAYIRTTFWAIILSPYNPPRKPASGLVLCSGNDVVDGDWYFSNTIPSTA